LFLLKQEKEVLEPGPVSDDTKREDTGASQDSGLPEFPNKDVNKRIAVVSLLAAAGLFLSSRLDFGVSLKDLSVAALPYEEVCFIGLKLEFLSNRLQLRGSSSSF
jgi:hypothetical protein